MKLSFVLVEPARAANVGAAARAMKTMGFTQLILINSKLNQQDEAMWLAHGSKEILENALLLDNFQQLRKKFDLIIGTTARERGSKKQYLKPNELLPIIKGNPQSNIAIVFGRESSGLTNTELNMCDLYSYVPLFNTYPSINLAQAVMVYSYALSQIQKSIGLQQNTAETSQLQSLKNKANLLMNQLEIKPNDKLSPWLLDHLSKLTERDCKMFHQFFNDINKKI